MREILQFQELFLITLKNLVSDLYEVIGEGMTLGMVWKSTREAFESMGYKGEDGFEVWNQLSRISKTKYRIKKEDGGIVKVVFDCEYLKNKKAIPAFCQLHKGVVEGLLGIDVELDTGMLRGEDHCSFHIKGINGKMKCVWVPKRKRYFLRRGIYLAPLLGLIKYMKTNFKDYETHLSGACKEAGRKFAEHLGIKSYEKAEKKFLRILGIKNNELIWKDIYSDMAGRIGVQDKDEMLSKIIGYQLGGFAAHYGKDIRIIKKDKGWNVMRGETCLLWI